MAEPADLTRRARRKLELRERMLAARRSRSSTSAASHATKVADICERADVAQKTFFNHFASKGQLLRALAEEASPQLLADIETARKAGHSTRDAPRALLRAAWQSARPRAGPMHRELLTEIIHAIHASGTEPDQARRLHAAFGALVARRPRRRRRDAPARARDAHRDAAGRVLRADVQLGEPRRLPDPRAGAAAARFLADALAPDAGELTWPDAKTNTSSCRYPNGWFAVAWSRDLHVGDVQPLHYFGEELVLFRTRSGQARVLDPFCPHLGAHLGHGGRVMGETIRCPFHGWQYDGAVGRVRAHPLLRAHPAEGARARVGRAGAERHGLRLVPQRGQAAGVGLPGDAGDRAPGLDASRARSSSCSHAHVQDTHENNNDPVHFQFVHGMVETPPGEISYSEGGAHYRMVNTSEQVTPFGTFRCRWCATPGASGSRPCAARASRARAC